MYIIQPSFDTNSSNSPMTPLTQNVSHSSRSPPFSPTVPFSQNMPHPLLSPTVPFPQNMSNSLLSPSLSQNTEFVLPEVELENTVMVSRLSEEESRERSQRANHPSLRSPTIDRLRSDPQTRRQLITSILSGKKKYSNNVINVKRLKADKIWYVMGTPEIKGHCADIARHYLINETTFRRWNRILEKDKDWQGPTYKKSQRGYIFSMEQENDIENLVKVVIDNYHQPMTNFLFRGIATRYLDSIPVEERQQPNLEFTASNNYIARFRKRHSFSRRRGHLKRRPEVHESIVQQFRQEFAEESKKYKPDHILNTDETFWRLNEFNLYTWAKYGSDNIIIDGNSNEKAGFTTLATISFDNGKFPLVHIAKGTSIAEEKWFSAGRSITVSREEMSNAPKIPDVEDPNSLFSAFSYTDHSEKGWTTTETWCRFLHKVREDFVPVLPGTDIKDPVNSILLLCDAFRAHHCQEAQDVAQSLNIKLLKIPPGTTDMCQPLDCRIFGALKAKAHAFMSRVFANHVLSFFDPQTRSFPQSIPPIEKMTHLKAMALLEKKWQELNSYSIEDSWIKSLFNDWDEEDGEEEKDDNDREEEDDGEEEEEEEVDDDDDDILNGTYDDDILHGTYDDDILHGTYDEEKARQKQRQIAEVLHDETKLRNILACLPGVDSYNAAFKCFYQKPIEELMDPSFLNSE